jgi:hypothetical protein
MRVLLALMLVSVALDGHAKTVLLTHMPLQWRPTSELASGTTDMDTTTIRFETFLDVRNDKEKVGENLEDDAPKPVTTTDDVGAFVSSHMRRLFDRAGLKTVDDAAAVTIKGRGQAILCQGDLDLQLAGRGAADRGGPRRQHEVERACLRRGDALRSLLQDRELLRGAVRRCRQHREFDAEERGVPQRLVASLSRRLE